MDTRFPHDNHESQPREEPDTRQIQRTEAIARLGGLDDLYADILGRFLDDSAGAMDKLRSHVAEGNLKKIHEAAHSLKGVAAMCGASGVAGVAAALERTAQTGHSDAVPQLIKRLEIELDQARQALSPYRRRQSQSS